MWLLDIFLLLVIYLIYFTLFDGSLVFFYVYTLLLIYNKPRCNFFESISELYLLEFVVNSRKTECKASRQSNN